MSSKLSNKFPIPNEFPEILHDFAKEVVRNNPKDILTFAVQYFYELEKNNCKDIPQQYSSSNIQIKTDSNKINNVNEKNLEIIKDNNNKEQISIDDKEKTKYTKTGSSFMHNTKGIETYENESIKSGLENVSGTPSQKEGVINFVGHLIKTSEETIQNAEELNDVSGSDSMKNGVVNFVGDVIKVSEENILSK